VVAFFQERFIRAILPLSILLKLTGVDITYPSGSKRKLVLLKLWKLSWFFLNFINQIFILLRRTLHLKFVPGFFFPFREYLIVFVNYSVSCTVDVLVHLLLLLSIRRTAGLFF